MIPLALTPDARKHLEVKAGRKCLSSSLPGNKMFDVFSTTGGRDPDAAGNTNCKDWIGGGDNSASSQTSVQLPYKDSLVIPEEVFRQ